MVTGMKHVHYLDRQHNHHLPSSFAGRSHQAQLQFLAAIDHVLQDMIDGVLVNSGPVGNDLANFATNATKETRGTGPQPVLRIVGKNPL